MDKGLSEKEILNIISEKTKKDFTYDCGRILSSMCSKPHRLGIRIYTECIEKNMADPFLFPSCSYFEREVVEMLGELLSSRDPHGFMVSGGTEANIIAMWVALKERRISNPEVIAPKSAHFSMDKASSLLGFRLVKIDLNHNFQVDIGKVEGAVTEKTVALVGVAGSTGLGVVDPIPELADIAMENNLYLHVDAAFGGLVLPFMEELGYDAPDFDFKLPSVCSIAVDPHKVGLAPIPSGCILFRDQSYMEKTRFKLSYKTRETCFQNTVLGTRPCASVIATWAVLKHLGREGFRSIVSNCLELTRFLCSEMKKLRAVKLVTEPTMNIVGIETDVDVVEVAEQMRKRGWGLTLYDDYIRVVLMPHLSVETIKNFINDLETVIKNIERGVKDESFGKCQGQGRSC